MATYSWKCDHCKYITEICRPMVDYSKPPIGCEHCGTLYGLWEKIIPKVDFVLKGDGWFRDGYQKEKK